MKNTGNCRANGYLGQGIVEHILDCGNEVVAADFAVDNIDGGLIGSMRSLQHS